MNKKQLGHLEKRLWFGLGNDRNDFDGRILCAVFRGSQNGSEYTSRLDFADKKFGSGSVNRIGHGIEHLQVRKRVRVVNSECAIHL